MTNNQATPRFPIPEGFRLLQVGEEILFQDNAVYKSDTSFSSAVTVRISGGNHVRAGDPCWYFRPIPATPAAAPKAEPKMLSQIPQDELFALHRACLNRDPAPTVSKTETTTEPKAAPEGAGTAPAREIQDLDRLERLLLDQGFRMDPEISYIRKALAERATLTAALAKAREALECLGALDLLYDEGMPILVRYGFNPETRFDVRATDWVKAKCAAALGNLEQKEGSV